MKYFILWVMFFNDGSYQPIETYTSLDECTRTERRLSDKAALNRSNFGYACLPEGMYPVAPKK
jgi:hypothetical protein